MQITLAELSLRINSRLEGDPEILIEGIAPLVEAEDGQLSFLTDRRWADQMASTRAAAVIVPEDFQRPPATKTALLFAADVFEAQEIVLDLFAPPPDLPEPGIHPAALVAPSAQLGTNVAIGPGVVIGEHAVVGNGTAIAAGCFIGRDVRLGKNCLLHPNVVIYARCTIGDHVILHANVTIGADGFGYRLVNGEHRRIKHIGSVLIEDHVEIGANSCVDRAKFGRTVIGPGAKIDNLVQIAHNVRIGKNCIIVAQTGIAGSARLGEYVVLGGQCGIRDHVRIGDGAMVGATSAVDQDIPPGMKIVGTPAQPVREFFRELSLRKKLPDLAQQIKQIQSKIDGILSSKNDHPTREN